MRCLLINANRMSNPPCIPLGVEHAAAALEHAGHSVRVLDLWHYDDALQELDRVLNEESFDIAGVSVRNLDTAQAAKYLNFIPDVRMISENVQRAGIKVILGGSGFSAMPREILEYTGADFGIAGPADRALPMLVGELGKNAAAWETAPLDARVVRAWSMDIDRDLVVRRAVHVKYYPYMEMGSVVGFATQYGCPRECLYCVEAGAGHRMRNPRAVLAELKDLYSQGFNDLHLCDSEFNHDPRHCMEVLNVMAGGGMEFRWALYMQPAPCSAELLDGLQRTGAYLITLSVDSAVACANDGWYGWDDVEFVLNGCRERGIKLAVDLTLGQPDEPESNARRAMDFFKKNRPDKVNVNAWLRVYGGTGLEALLRQRPELHGHLSDPMPPGPPLEKLFYNQLPMEEIAAMIDGDPVFKLEGFDPGTNYEIIGREEQGS